MRRFGISWAILLLLGGCGGLPANVIVLMPDDDGHTGKVAVTNKAGKVDLDQPLAATELAAASEPAFAAKQKDVNEAFGATIAATPRKPVSFVLYFRSEAADILPDSQPTLTAAIAAAKAQTNIDISVVGHSDAAGDPAYNLALSLRRADAVRKALIAAGISADVIEVSYHGANNPLVPTAPGAHEPRNRRVEVTVR